MQRKDRKERKENKNEKNNNLAGTKEKAELTPEERQERVDDLMKCVKPKD